MTTRGQKCLGMRPGKGSFPGVAWPRDAKPASPTAVGGALHSKPGLNFPFAGRLASVLLENGNSGLDGLQSRFR